MGEVVRQGILTASQHQPSLEQFFGSLLHVDPNDLIGEDRYVEHSAQRRQITIRGRDEFTGFVNVDHEAPFLHAARGLERGCASRASAPPRLDCRAGCPLRDRSPQLLRRDERPPNACFGSCRRESTRQLEDPRPCLSFRRPGHATRRESPVPDRLRRQWTGRSVGLSDQKSGSQALSVKLHAASG